MVHSMGIRLLRYDSIDSCSIDLRLFQLVIPARHQAVFAVTIQAISEPSSYDEMLIFQTPYEVTRREKRCRLLHLRIFLLDFENKHEVSCHQWFDQSEQRRSITYRCLSGTICRSKLSFQLRWIILEPHRNDRSGFAQRSESNDWCHTHWISSVRQMFFLCLEWHGIGKITGWASSISSCKTIDTRTLLCVLRVGIWFRSGSWVLIWYRYVILFKFRRNRRVTVVWAIIRNSNRPGTNTFRCWIPINSIIHSSRNSAVSGSNGRHSFELKSEKNQILVLSVFHEFSTLRRLETNIWLMTDQANISWPITIGFIWPSVLEHMSSPSVSGTPVVLNYHLTLINTTKVIWWPWQMTCVIFFFVLSPRLKMWSSTIRHRHLWLMPLNWSTIMKVEAIEIDIRITEIRPSFDCPQYVGDSVRTILSPFSSEDLQSRPLVRRCLQIYSSTERTSDLYGILSTDDPVERWSLSGHTVRQPAIYVSFSNLSMPVFW